MHPADAIEELRIPSPEEAAALRQVLAAAGFSDKVLIEKLGDVSLPTPRTHNLPRLLRRTAGGTPLDTLARLFLFGVPVPAEAAAAALAPVPLESVYRMGLVKAEGAAVVSTVVLYPYGPLLVIFDRPDKVVGGAPRDLVMGITSSTMDVANFAVRAEARNALDLGTGCGFHAFLAAPHSQRVYAVDVSPKALSFARFGAALNGLTNVECRLGDRFEPVRGLRFDLIVGNLPFVIAPASSYQYRDSGMPVDTFAESVLRAAPEFLEEGGFCQVICEWAHVAGQDWQQRLGSWCEGSGCDAFVLKLSTAQPLLYAEMWIRDTEQDDPEIFARTYHAWADWYEANRIEAISTGLIALRRRAGGRNWFHVDDWPERAPEGFGKHVARRFALFDFLERLEDDDALLASRLAVSPDTRLVSKSEWVPDGWRTAEARVCLESFPAYAGNIDSRSGHLMSLCNGTRTLRESIALLAATVKVDPQRITAPALPLIRHLLERGFLVPAE